MIRKLRGKLVAICMILVTAVLAIVFYSVHSAVEQNIENLSRQLLWRVIQEDTLFSGNGSGAGAKDRPDIGIDIDGDRIMLPYFTVVLYGDTAYVTGGTYADLENTEELQAILKSCIAQQTSEGVIEEYQMRYLRQDNGLFQRLAFVDMSMEVAMLKEMMGPYLQIAAASFVLLLAASIFLSYWVTAPVERAWKQQRQFLSDASHELKTPLTVILSNAELLETAALEERPARWSDNIRSEAVRMKKLVEEMLTLARADNMVRTAVMAEISFSDTAEECVLAFEPVAFEAGKRLEFDIAEGASVLGDADQLKQVISILLDNAIKYGSREGAITLSLQKTDRQARLTVSNPGDPIPPEQLQRLFERFYRADASRGEQTGFGLGLSIAATIAADHKGSLKAFSDESSTRFVLTLPLKK